MATLTMSPYEQLLNDLKRRGKKVSAEAKSDLSEIMLEDLSAADKLTNLRRYFLRCNMEIGEESENIDQMTDDAVKTVISATCLNDANDVNEKLTTVKELSKWVEAEMYYIEEIKDILKNDELDDEDKVKQIELLLI